MKTLYKLFLLIALTALSNFSFAQNRDYVPMLNEGAKWIETNYYSPNPYGYNQAFELFLEGDTVINDISYTKLYKGMISVFCMENYIWGPEYFCALREEMTTQKVWIIEADENEESLYFDFTLSIGDTVPDDCNFIEEYSPVVVHDIDIVTGLDDVERRQWTFEYQGETYGSKMVEGIGNMNGLLSSYFIPFEYFENLFCFTIDATQVYGYDCILPSDTCLTVGIPELNSNSQKNNDLLVYPVPANDLVYIQFKDEITSHTNLQIVDYTGRLIYSKVIENNFDESINVANWPAGIYFAIIQEDGQAKVKCKFVVE